MKNQLVYFVVMTVMLCPCSSGQWVKGSNGPSSTVSCLLTIDTCVLGGTFSEENYRSTDCGTTWKGIATLQGNAHSFAVSGTKTLAGSYTGVWLSSDSGSTWSPVLGGLASEFYSVAGDSSLAFAGSVNYPALEVSTDHGLTWSQVGGGPNVYLLARAAGILFLHDQVRPSGDLTYLSTDDGLSWTGPSLVNNRVYCFGVHKSLVFAGTAGSGVFRYSISTGWVAASGALSGTIWSFASDGANLFAGTNHGLFLSRDDGESWTQMDGLSTERILAITICETFIIVGTDVGIWRRPLSEIVSVDAGDQMLPARLSLEQNYPNPFNPRTVISYQLPVASKVELAVHDMLGRKVATLVNEVKQPGRHEVEFDGSGLASGMYIVRLIAGDLTATRKMVLTK